MATIPHFLISCCHAEARDGTVGSSERGSNKVLLSTHALHWPSRDHVTLSSCTNQEATWLHNTFVGARFSNRVLLFSFEMPNFTARNIRGSSLWKYALHTIAIQVILVGVTLQGKPQTGHITNVVHICGIGVLVWQPPEPLASIWPAPISGIGQLCHCSTACFRKLLVHLWAAS